MEPDDQTNIPTQPVSTPGKADTSPGSGLSDTAMGALFGAARSQAGGTWAPPSPEELQRDFPQYEIRGILGRGGMGAVYKGWQKSLDRVVAIKILPPGFDDGLAGFTERFKREAKAMARLKHPGIVAVYDAGETASGLLYFIMECVEGTDVHQLVKERGRLEPAEALRITTAVCDALGYAHEHGIVHRDIKPSNVMLDADGTVKVADFGLAKTTAAETTQLTMSNVAMGTPDFMAPESHFGTAQVDHRADLYAVGVMLYQMLTGQLPKGRFDPPSRIVPGLDKRLDAVVDKALQTQPAARWSSAAEMRAATEPVTRTLSKRIADTTGPAATRRGTRSTLVAVAISIITIAVVAYFKPWRNTEGPSTPSALSTSPGQQDSQTSPSNAQWVRLLDKPEDAAKANPRGTGVTWDKGWLVPVSDKVERGIASSCRSGSVRMRVRHVATPGMGGTIKLRSEADKDGNPQSYELRVANGKELRLSYVTIPRGQTSANIDNLAVVLLPRPLAEGEEYTLQLTMVGDRIQGRMNDLQIGPVTDTRLRQGAIGVWSGKLPIRDIEYLNLDGLSEAEALKAAGLASAPLQPAQWSDLTADLRSWGLANGSLKMDGDWLEATRSAWPSVAGSRLFRDFAIRITYANRIEVQFRKTAAGSYAASAEGDICGLVVTEKNDDRQRLGPVTRLTRDYDPRAPHQFLLLARGPQLSIWIDGRKQAEAVDTRHTEGGISLSLFVDRKAQPPRIKEAEYLLLDGLSEAEALKAAGLDGK